MATTNGVPKKLTEKFYYVQFPKLSYNGIHSKYHPNFICMELHISSPFSPSHFVLFPTQNCNLPSLGWVPLISPSTNPYSNKHYHHFFFNYITRSQPTKTPWINRVDKEWGRKPWFKWMKERGLKFSTTYLIQRDLDPSHDRLVSMHMASMNSKHNNPILTILNLIPLLIFENISYSSSCLMFVTFLKCLRSKLGWTILDKELGVTIKLFWASNNCNNFSMFALSIIVLEFGVWGLFNPIFLLFA